MTVASITPTLPNSSSAEVLNSVTSASTSSVDTPLAIASLPSCFIMYFKASHLVSSSDVFSLQIILTNDSSGCLVLYCDSTALAFSEVTFFKLVWKALPLTASHLAPFNALCNSSATTPAFLLCSFAASICSFVSCCTPSSAPSAPSAPPACAASSAACRSASILAYSAKFAFNLPCNSSTLTDCTVTLPFSSVTIWKFLSFADVSYIPFSGSISFNFIVALDPYSGGNVMRRFSGNAPSSIVSPLGNLISP